MRRLACLILLVLVPCAWAEEEPGTRCGLYAFVDDEDAGLLALYDGLRKGLELAQLPRVCRADPDPASGGAAGFLERLAAGAAVDRAAGLPVGPVFAVGDQACRTLAELGTRLPRVLAVERYTRGRKPLRALPVGDGAAVVYAALGVEDVGGLLRRLSGRGHPAVAWAWDARAFPASAHRPVMAFAEAAGVRLKAAEAGAGVGVLLHLRLGVGERVLPFDEALALARRLGVPLVSDDRGRFGQGAVVTLVGRHDLVGRHAADAARRLRTAPDGRLLPRAVPGVEMWIDLRSADAQGLHVPLSVLSRADRLRRGLPAVGGAR